MSALRQDLHIYQGQTWSFPYLKKDAGGNPVDMTGWSARMSIKGTYNGVLQAALRTDLDSFNGSIALGSNGVATLSMTADQTSALAGELNALTVVLLNDRLPIEAAFDFVDVTKPTARYIYDLVLTDPAGVATREIEGNVIVHRQVST